MTDLAAWMVEHYRDRARETSVRAVALRMRKQGWPLHVALAILCGPAKAVEAIDQPKTSSALK